MLYTSDITIKRSLNSDFMKIRDAHFELENYMFNGSYHTTLDNLKNEDFSKFTKNIVDGESSVDFVEFWDSFGMKINNEEVSLARDNVKEIRTQISFVESQITETIKEIKKTLDAPPPAIGEGHKQVNLYTSLVNKLAELRERLGQLTCSLESAISEFLDISKNAKNPILNPA